MVYHQVKKVLSLTLGAVVFGFGLVVIQAAWSEPLASAPTCTSGNPGCDAPLTTESDPQVGTLTDTKWCTSNGTAVNCTSDAPSGSQWTTNGSNIGYASGNVGIGTTSSVWPLEVVTSNGWSGLTIHEQSNNDNGAVVNVYKERGTSAASANDWVGGIQYNIKDSGGNFQNIAAIHAQTTNVTDGSETGQLHFYTRNGATWGDRMVVDKDGNVGIGTTSPGQKLDVVNTIRAAAYSTTTDAGGSPFFVLQKSHNNGEIGTLTTTVSGESAGIIDWRGVDSASSAMTLGSIQVIQSAAAGVGNWKTPATMYFNVGSTAGVVNAMYLSPTQTYFPMNVGIGASSAGQKLDITGGNGRVASGYSWLTNSDSRFKKNITTLTSVLDKIANLRGVRFDLIDDENSIEGQGKNIGVIAQELEAVYPELVVTDENGYKSVAYDKISAVLLQAIKEQQGEIESINEKVNTLIQDNLNLKAELCTKDSSYFWCE